MFHSLLLFWLTVADSFLVTLVSAPLWELFDLSDPLAAATNNNRTKWAAAKAGKLLCIFHALPVRSQLFGDCLMRQIGSD